MKRLLLTAALAGTIIAAGLPAVAQTATDSQTTAPATTQQQEGHHHGRRGKKRFEHMAKKLNLTQDQQNQLKPIFEQQHQQVQAIRNDSSLTQDQKQEKIQSLRQSTMAQMNNILTPAQQQQWQQMRAKHRHEKDGGQPQAAAPQGQ